MKSTRLIPLFLLGVIIGGAYTPLQANAEVNSVQVEKTTEKLKVVLNGNEINEGGYMIDGRAYLAIRQLSEVLQAFISWDDVNKKVLIDKPNVDLLVMGNKKIFNKAKLEKIPFYILVQGDHVPTKVEAIKLTMTDPKGKTVIIEERNINVNDNCIGFMTTEREYDFNVKGNYTVSCYLKQKDDEYTIIAQKNIPTN